MPTLTLGANTALATAQCNVTLSSTLAIGNNFGALWLPLDGSRQVVTSPAYLHEPKDWASVDFDSNQNSATWSLDIAKVFEQHHAQLLQLIVYEYVHPDMALPAVELNNISLKITCPNNADIDYQFTTPERHVKASIVLEIYQRNGQYKCRALAENSTQSLSNFAQKLQISLDARHPSIHQNLQQHPDQRPNARPRPQPGETWTGTAFAIDPYHLLTCEHVIDGAKLIGLRQQGYADMEAQVVLADAGSDTALLKVNQPLPAYLPLREKGYDLLGESVTAMGFPLTGLGSQLQVTQGNIAGLQGLHNDIRFIQFTAPIQPGSSGSPLLLPTGEVVGMVTHTISNAQNMNYAVKYQLLSALLASGGLNLADLIHQNVSVMPLSTPQLTKQSKNALWLVGCEA